MNIVCKNLLASFIFCFFLSTAYTMVDHNPAITSKEQVFQYFRNRNISNGILVVTRNGCGPCEGYKSTLNQYFEKYPARASGFVFINASYIPREDMQNPNKIIAQLNVTAAPSTYKVFIDPSGNSQISSAIPRTPHSFQEIDSLFYW